MINKRLFTILILFALLGISGWRLAAASPQAKTYIVNSNTNAADANPGDGNCATAGGNCTLNAAIQEANRDGVASTIKFASMMEITPVLPSSPPYPLTLTEAGTVIDASDRWNIAMDSPGVKISGGNHPNGLLRIQASGCAVYGVEFSGGESVGIKITGNNNTIGGSQTGQRNVFILPGTGSGEGVWIDGGGEQNNIRYNYFGTRDGVVQNGIMKGVFAQYGGLNIIEHNLIVGSTVGIEVWSQSNTIRNNTIGADKSQTSPLPNTTGIIINGEQNTIGPDNFIAANSQDGIYLRRDNNSIFGNQIGSSLPNMGNGGDGLHLHSSNNNLIGGTYFNEIVGNGGHGIFIEGDGNLLQGNHIYKNDEAGVYIQGGDNLIGGASGGGNQIYSNGGHGVHLNGVGASHNRILGNYIGFPANGGVPSGNLGHGIFLENGASVNIIGSSDPGEGNWIGGYAQDLSKYGLTGIYLHGSDTSDNTITGNVIGAPNLWQWPLPIGNHGIGIYDGSHNNIVTLNIIVSAGWSGIAIVKSDDNLIFLNKIGTDGADIHWGNNYYGVDIYDGSGNLLMSNEIAYNGMPDGEDGAEAGVWVHGGLAIANPLSVNSIHDNDGPGILLSDGGNYGLGAPIITQASCQGPVSGDTCADCVVEIFSDSDDEGRIHESSVTADSSGAFTWHGTPNGPNMTATATHPVGHTSPFSAPFNVGTCNTAPTAAFTVSPGSGTPSTVFHFDASGSSDPEDPASALQVRWDWENDGIFDTAWSISKLATHAYSTVGTYTVRLEVQDTRGLLDAVTHQVDVSSTPSHSIYLPLVQR